MTAPALATVGPVLPPPAHDAPLPPARLGAGGTRVLAGVPYAALPGARPLELDLYLPPTDAQAPLVVFVHGGGWRLGSRHSAGPAYRGADPTPFEQVALAGIAVASVDHRLSGEAVWPAQLHDVKAAVRWLRFRGGEVGIDPARVAAWGESAGGHLAALLGLTGDRMEGEVGVTGPSSGVVAVAAWYPPTDLAALAADNGADPGDPDSREAQLLGAPVAAVPELAAQASPVSYGRAAVPAAARAGRPVRPVPAERAAVRGAARRRDRRPAAHLRRRRPHVEGLARGGDRRPGTNSCLSARTSGTRSRHMRIVGIRRDGGDVEVAALSDDGTEVAPLAPLARFWADPAAALAGPTGAPAAVADVQLVPPVLAGARVICIGLNYLKHVAEGSFAGSELPEHPTLFARWTSSLTVDGAEVPVPSNEDGLDWEGEVMAWIGAPLVDASPEEALAAVLGYSTFNDLTSRRAQKLTSQWILGKNGDRSGPVGPMVPAAEVGDLRDGLRVRTRVNGETVQDGCTDEMVYTVGDTLSLVSHTFSVRPGDLLATGTPAGVGYGRTPPWLLQPGDEVEVEVDRLGVLRNRIVGNDARPSLEP